MRKIIIAPADDLAQQARLEATGEGGSFSRLVAELPEQRCEDYQCAKLAVLRTFFDGPGYPGISKVWRDRDALYAERENRSLGAKTRPVQQAK